VWEQNSAPPPVAQQRVVCNLIVGSTESAEVLYVLILYCQSMFVSIMEYPGKFTVLCYHSFFITAFEFTDAQYQMLDVLLDQRRENKIHSTHFFQKVK